MEFPEVREEIISWGRRTRTHCPDHKAIVNASTGETFAIVSNNYQLVKHEDAIQVVMDAIEMNPEFGRHDIDTKLLQGGAKMKSTIRFPEVQYDIRGGDLINPTVEIRNSYDTGWQYSILFGAFRLVCSNGLIIGKKFVHYVKKHTQALDQEHVKSILVEGMEQFSYQTELWKSWADQVTTSSEYEHVMENVGFSDKEAEEIHQQVEEASDIFIPDERIIALNKWVFYNILTAHISHRISSELRRANLENRMRRLF